MNMDEDSEVLARHRVDRYKEEPRFLGTRDVIIRKEDREKKTKRTIRDTLPQSSDKSRPNPPHFWFHLNPVLLHLRLAVYYLPASVSV